MPSRSLRDQKSKKPAQWPPPIWPPVGGDVDLAVPDETPDIEVIPPGGTPFDRALDRLTSSLLEDQAARPEHPYLHDPEGWVTDVLGEYAWSTQRAIARSVRDNRRTAVPSAHETGKSWLAARIIAWWLSVHAPGEAFAVTTAPSASQVRAILWREINRAHRKGNLPGRTNQTEWWIGEELVGFGRKPADYSPTAFQGIHAKYVLVVLDEACHDDQTDVMTEDGWRRFADLDGSERLLTMDPLTHMPSYALPTRLITKPYRGPMYRYAARNASFSVTPDHRMYYRPKLHRAAPYGAWRTAEIETIKATHNQYMTRTVHWDAPDVGRFELPACVGERRTLPPRSLAMDDWLAFLGWWCSEGSLIKRRDRVYGAAISQSDPSVLAEIHALCLRLGFPAKLYARQVHIHSMQVGRYLATLGDDCLTKAPPRMVGTTSPRQIGIFLDAYVRGDGYRRNNGREIIYTSSPRMADALQELILKTGVDSVIRKRALAGVTSDLGTHTATSSVDGFVVSRAARPSALKFLPRNVQEVPYDGMVYCATVPPHHLLLTRRDGYALWSGNCGIPVEIWRAAQSLVANENGRMLAIGNPDDPTSHFATICGPDTGWNVIPVSAFDTPNFTGEAVPDELRPLLVSHIYTEELAADVGVDSPIYISKALGRFPENAAGGVIPLSMVRACQQLDREWTYTQMMPVELGMDVGAGGDQTVIRERRGPVAGRTWRKSTPNWSDAVAVALDAIQQTGASRIKIDVIGIGWGVVGRLRELRKAGKHACQVIGVNVGAASTNPDRYPKLRDQLWWEIGRELSRAKAWDLAAVDDATAAQLIAPQWQPDSAGRIHVEPKRKTIERIKRSPDDADALLLAYYTPVLTKAFTGASGGQRPVITAATIGAAAGKLVIPPKPRRQPGRVLPFRPAGPDGRPLPNPYRRRIGGAG